MKPETRRAIESLLWAIAAALFLLAGKWAIFGA